MEILISYYIISTVLLSFLIPKRRGYFYIAPLLLAAAPAAFQAYKGLRQRYLAKKLKESKFVPPELMANQALSRQQAQSRRAPGQAIGEENIRRNLATTLGAQSRMYGGDANKMVSVASGASGRANDAVRGLQAQGQAFSENAYGRLMGANASIAGQKRQNRDEYNRTKAQLLAASDQNLFNSVNNLSTVGLMGAAQGTGKAAEFSKGMLNAQNPWNQFNQFGPPNQFDPYLDGYYEDPGFSSPGMRVQPRVNRRFN